MIAVASNGEAVVLPVRQRSQVGAWVRMCTLLGLTLCALFYVIGAHVQADAAQVEQVRQACLAKADDVDNARFNPCATLDTTQVQDRRVGAPTCVWDKQGEAWVSLPCHYTDDTLDLTITQQP